jgi:hypothetical protein
MLYLILLLLSSLVGCANGYSEECFYKVGEGALGMSLWNHGGGSPEKFGNHWSIWSAIGNVIHIFIHILTKCIHVCEGKGQLVSECQLELPPVEGEWLVVVRPLLSSKRRPVSRLVKVWERTKIWSWFPTERETKTDCAGKDQQQFYPTAWPHYPKSNKTSDHKKQMLKNDWKISQNSK